MRGIPGFTLERLPSTSLERGRYLAVRLICQACGQETSWHMSESGAIVEASAHRKQCEVLALNREGLLRADRLPRITRATRLG